MISAIVLAAGESRRMGQPKMLMPWGDTSVIGSVVSRLFEANVTDIVVVTGRLNAEIVNELDMYTVHYIMNNDYANGEMLTSAQVGLKNVGDETEAALLVLGDQPQIEVRVVTEILDRYNTTHYPIIIPSYKMHRGHPWLIEKSLWRDIQKLNHPDTLRSFLNSVPTLIDYINVDTPSVIQDLDTPKDYSIYKP
jgi:molybdenum cofactor cytidylyltransferase